MNENKEKAGMKEKLKTKFKNFWSKLWNSGKHLFIKRVFICFSIYVIAMLLMALYYTIQYKTIEGLNKTKFKCIGTFYCSYSGAKMFYGNSVNPTAEKLKNGNIVVYHNDCVTWPEGRKYYAVCKYLHCTPLVEKIDKKISSKRKGNTAELYNAKTKRFRKLEGDRGHSDLIGQNKVSYISELKDGSILINNTILPAQTYDFKTKTYTDLDLYGDVLTKIDNKLLMIKNSHLFLFDIDKLEKQPVAQFEKKPENFPLTEKIINIPNEKILIPIKTDNGLYHIEIYDYKTKSFTARYIASTILDDNMFVVKRIKDDMVYPRLLTDKYLLFVNKEKTYIYPFKENDFYEINEYQKIHPPGRYSDEALFYKSMRTLWDIHLRDRFQFPLKNITFKTILELDETYYLTFSDNITRKYSYKKYFITCSDDFIKSHKIRNINEICKKLVVYEINSNIFFDNEYFDFPNYTYGAKPVKIDDTSVMLIGGKKEGDDNVYQDRVQISKDRIEIMNKYNDIINKYEIFYPLINHIISKKNHLEY